MLSTTQVAKTDIAVHAAKSIFIGHLASHGRLTVTLDCLDSGKNIDYRICPIIYKWSPRAYASRKATIPFSLYPQFSITLSQSMLVAANLAVGGGFRIIHTVPNRLQRT